MNTKSKPYSATKTIALIGIMGVGKTTVGRRLAAMLNLPFFDADAEIENAAGMSVADYFSEYGEEEFRRGERRVIRRLLQEGPHVLATGGGAFVQERTRNIIKKNAISVWLQADLETIVERTGRRETRPLLKNTDSRKVLKELLETRTPYYAMADVTVETSDGSHTDTAQKIVTALKEYAG